jgi:DMSO/TMAO reductase YedYZ molybdopterin-dependent catalytic subunit
VNLTPVLKPDLIVRTEQPPNVEGRAELLMGQETPVEHFFVCCHGPVPVVDPGAWRLEIGGLAGALSLDYAAMTALPAETRRLLLECAGNGRRLFDPPAQGLAWGRAALGQARWTGTRLDALLDRAGLAAGAAHVIFHALGDPAEGKPRFVRSLPIAEVRARGVLLAWAMNGEPLLPEHGFPLRVVVPGWTGQHWIKWLTRIDVTDAEAGGPYMRDEYRETGGAMIRGARVKALVTSPADGARLRGRTLALSGIAWAGECDVARVEVSLDDGATWREAAVSGYGGQGAWRRWDLAIELEATATGTIAVAARATDDHGRTQPRHGAWHPLGYLWNGWDRLSVVV